MTAEAILPPLPVKEEAPTFKAEETAIIRKPATAIKRWIRLDTDQRFGSITGAEFRVWGGEK